MSLMERVTTLIRANLNDLIDKAEEPEKMLKQVMLDMHNQLMQVKTQVAIAITDQHLLAKKHKDAEEKAAEWVRKAELAVGKNEDVLARAALERSIQCQSTADGLGDQVKHQSVQVDNLKSALRKLQDKLAEAQAKCDLLAAQHRRARTLAKAGDANPAASPGNGEMALQRIESKVAMAGAVGQAKIELAEESLEDRLAKLDKHDQVERLLAEIKSRKG